MRWAPAWNEVREFRSSDACEASAYYDKVLYNDKVVAVYFLGSRRQRLPIKARSCDNLRLTLRRAALGNHHVSYCCRRFSLGRPAGARGNNLAAAGCLRGGLSRGRLSCDSRIEARCPEGWRSSLQRRLVHCGGRSEADAEERCDRV